MAVPTNVFTTFGAIEIGVFLALFLFGIVTAQASVYFQRFPEDPLHIKSLVRLVLQFSRLNGTSLNIKHAQVGLVW
jgi:hypothetical protein